MMTWNRLFADFDAALAAQAERPYDPVKVQGLGMRFADAWNYHKGPICILLGESPDDFSYVKWRDWVPAVRKLMTAKQWRCVNCKLVITSATEPKECTECWCRTFAEIAPSRSAEIAAAIAAFTLGVINDPVALAAWKEQQEKWEATLDENWIGVGPSAENG